VLLREIVIYTEAEQFFSATRRRVEAEAVCVYAIAGKIIWQWRLTYQTVDTGIDSSSGQIQHVDCL
jgi:hypothetical protein